MRSALKLAVVLDSIALLGLILIAVGGYLGFGLGIVVAAFGALLGLALPFGFTVSWQLVRQELRRRGSGRVVAGVVLGVSVAAAVVVAPAVLWLAGGLTPNPAAARLQPVLDEIEEQGGVRICDNGDPGLGPDNIQPWKLVYYRVPDRAGLTDRVGQSAARAGLTSTTGLYGLHFTSWATAKTVPLNCSQGTYGRAYTPPAGQLVLAVDLELPPR